MTGTRSAKRGSHSWATSLETALKRRSSGDRSNSSSLRQRSPASESSSRPSANQRLPADGGDRKPWVALERGQHLLTGETGSAQNAGPQAFGHATTAGWGSISARA